MYLAVEAHSAGQVGNQNILRGRIALQQHRGSLQPPTMTHPHVHCCECETYFDTLTHQGFTYYVHNRSHGLFAGSKVRSRSGVWPPSAVAELNVSFSHGASELLIGKKLRIATLHPSDLDLEFQTVFW